MVELLLLGNFSGGASGSKLARPKSPEGKNFGKLIIHEGYGRIALTRATLKICLPTAVLSK